MNCFTSVYVDFERRNSFICGQETDYKKIYIDTSSSFSDVLVLYYIDNVSYQKKISELLGFIYFLFDCIETNRIDIILSCENNFENKIILCDLLKKMKNTKNNLFIFEINILYLYHFTYFQSYLCLTNLITNNNIEIYKFTISQRCKTKIYIQTNNMNKIELSFKTLIFLYENHNKYHILEKYIKNDIYFMRMIYLKKYNLMDIINEIIYSYPNIYFSIQI
jgi:hypothetical protein